VHAWTFAPHKLLIALINTRKTHRFQQNASPELLHCMEMRAVANLHRNNYRRETGIACPALRRLLTDDHFGH